jgi:hypothetical protein
MCSISYCSLQLWPPVHPRLFFCGNPGNHACMQVVLPPLYSLQLRPASEYAEGLSRYANSFGITFFATLRGRSAVRWKEQVR